MSEAACYTLISQGLESETPNEQQLKHELEHGDKRAKAQALKKIMTMVLNGDRLPGLLMTIIRFVLPSQDHTLKKLLLIFWEIWPKTSPDGKLLHEMILVCDAYRKDLQHPNEFVRGSTLRFLCKLKEPELLEPLMPSIRTCLEHRHAYVRRNAVLAIYTIYKNFDQLIPDAPELIQSYLEGEQDPSCKRNAFMMLVHVDRERALDYLTACIDQVSEFNDIMQLVIVELVYKVCYSNPSERPRFIRCIYNLLNSSSAAVRYEAAGTLVTLSSSPTSIKAAIQCYIELVVKESDNNVKLIVLDRLIALKEIPSHKKVLQELVMDILRVLSQADIEVRKKILALVLDLVNSRNIDEVVMLLKKEVTSTGSPEDTVATDDLSSYRLCLVKTLHACSIRFSSVAPSAVPMLLDFLTDTDANTAEHVLMFVREAIQRYPDLKGVVVGRLIEEFSQIHSADVHQSVLWILGEYCTSIDDINLLMQEMRTCLGEIPIVESELRKQAGTEEDTEGEMVGNKAKGGGGPMVTADGTYVSQSALSTATVRKEETIPPIRQYLLDGKFFVAGVIASTLTKLTIRLMDEVTEPLSRNQFSAEAMLIMASILHLGRSGIPKKPMTGDDIERVCICLRVLAERNPMMSAVFGERSREALASMLSAKETVKEEEKDTKRVEVHADDGIVFQLLSGADEFVGENKFDASLLQATGGGAGDGQSTKDMAASKLNKVVQLTGFSDPVYAEAYVNVNEYDIVLDVLVVNQTSDTLQGLSLELATLGDLRLVEKPSPITLGPQDFASIRASIKVSSTENGIIFGNIIYDTVGSTSDRNCVILNNVHIDIMDYIQPASCTDTEFRRMWLEFEWENKINLNTNILELNEFLEHILKSTNMNCLTPKQALTGDCGFLAANLYARSIFGEDALANISIEKPIVTEGNLPQPVQGHVRIRAKTQGMALSLGDKITACQKK